MYFSGVTTLTAAEPHFRINISNMTVTYRQQRKHYYGSIQYRQESMLCRCTYLSTRYAWVRLVA